jgi:hypothetical protein
MFCKPSRTPRLRRQRDFWSNSRRAHSAYALHMWRSARTPRLVRRAIEGHLATPESGADGRTITRSYMTRRDEPTLTRVVFGSPAELLRIGATSLLENGRSSISLVQLATSIFYPLSLSYVLTLGCLIQQASIRHRGQRSFRGFANTMGSHVVPISPSSQMGWR